MANPVLAELLRGGWPENRYRGCFCISDPSGAVLASAGDIDQAIFPRSAVKSMQALAIFASGADRRFELTDEMIAIAAASHMGEPEHIALVADFLARIGLRVDDLECGAHWPSNSGAAKAMRERGEEPTALCNNCSGKHSGMLAVALALGAPTKNYVDRDHPVQVLVRRQMEIVLGASLAEDRCGTDGCSIPTWAAPVRALAGGFARMATGNGLPDDVGAAARRIFDAATAHPFLVRGTGTLDTDLMAAFSGRLMIKIGAEGVFCGALRDRGLGFTLKIDDGNMQAAETVAANLLMAVAEPNDQERQALRPYLSPINKNWRKIEVSTMNATGAARPKL